MSFSDPLSVNQVTDLQRDRAVDYLQHAFATGVIDTDGFEERVATALTATSRMELNSSLRGIARVADASMALGAVPMARPQVVSGAENVGAGFTHLSGFFFPFFLGPIIVKAVARPGSRLWLEAGRALSFQLTALSAAVVLGIVLSILGIGGGLFTVGVIGWLITTTLLAIRAFQGQNSTAGIERFMPFKPPRENRQLGR
ncbi:MAG: DUF1707 and DUF4870 domain-containing protein [Propionibacteriaceae bacterium]|nr:DUF1707 and DUF4870 domain-containing protein [Propionibacteriaceae bacterium]